MFDSRYRIWEWSYPRLWTCDPSCSVWGRQITLETVDV